MLFIQTGMDKLRSTSQLFIAVSEMLLLLPFGLHIVFPACFVLSRPKINARLLS
jgi:hypothetical protein